MLICAAADDAVKQAKNNLDDTVHQVESHLDDIVDSSTKRHVNDVVDTADDILSSKSLHDDVEEVSSLDDFGSSLYDDFGSSSFDDFGSSLYDDFGDGFDDIGIF